MGLVRRSNSIVSGLQRISRTCSLRALNSRTNLVRRSNSIVSGLRRISRTCSLRALNSRTNLVRRSHSMNGLQLNYISQTCSLRAFHPGIGDDDDDTSMALLSSGWSCHRRSAIQKYAILRLVPNIGLSYGCKMTSEPCHTEKGRRRSANICVVRLR
jgi:hypothetical protein